MKIGVCTTLDNIERVLKSGADFIEVAVVPLNALSEEEVERYANTCKGKEEFLYSANCLVGGDLRLTGTDVNYDKIRNYTQKTFALLDKIGIKKLVFGSASPKKVPDGFSMDEAWAQLVKVVDIFATEAKKHGQTVIIEPLNRNECNIINTVRDAVNLVKAVNRDNVTAHVDYYHFTENGESLDELAELIPYIGHAHIASPVTRSYPRSDDGADYKAFFEVLRKGGYDETISCECGMPETDEEWTELISFLKSL